MKNVANTMDGYLKKIFALMFGAVGLTAVVTYMIIWCKELQFLIMPPLYYVLLFGGLAFSIWAQVRAFSMKPATAALMLMIYAVIMGIVITPLVAVSLSVNPMSIFYAFVLSAAMFGCMALFGYKTVKDLSFLGIFLFMGMIGLILVGIASMIWPLGGTFATIVSFIGVLVFALFTAYDMQNLKNAYNSLGNDEYSKNQLSVLGALHLYISFIAMFQYLLSLFNRD
jgi:FtsH-binding integral membrane protein